MEIKLELVPKEQRQEIIKDEDKLGFGKIFTDHIFIQEYGDGEWKQPRITKLHNFSLHPGSLVFHYGQEIFEGQKCFRHKDGNISLFRPEKNIRRFNLSAKRMMMPEVDEKLFLQALKKLISIEREWVPSSVGTALYIRPTMIATETTIELHPSKEYIFFILLSPVGFLYKTGINPVKIHVETEYIRAAEGGCGETKTGGNYAGSFLSAERARKNGFGQVLWLDAKERKYVEEVGSMNIMFVFGDNIITPPLSGTVLSGVTRYSTIELCKHLKIPIEEKRITIDEVIDGIKSGSLTEAFGTGTAASIVPIGELNYKGNAYKINNEKMGEVTKKLYQNLVGIQQGEKEDTFGWNVIIH